MGKLLLKQTLMKQLLGGLVQVTLFSGLKEKKLLSLTLRKSPLLVIMLNQSLLLLQLRIWLNKYKAGDEGLPPIFLFKEVPI
jgi:hypothetical protein